MCDLERLQLLNLFVGSDTICILWCCIL